MESKINKNEKDRFWLRELEFDFLRGLFEFYSEELKIFTIAMLFSNHSTKSFFRIQTKLRQDNFKRVLDRHQKKGYIKIIKDEIHLTKLGEKIFLQNKLVRDIKTKKKKWDKKWRMLTFDIPNDLGNIRDSLRRILLRAGFLQIQKSVYIYPHEIKDFLHFLEKHEDYKKYIIYSEITKSTAEKDWLNEFKDLINK